MRSRLFVSIGGVSVVLTLFCLAASGVRQPDDFADSAVLTPAFWAAGAIAYAYRPQLRCAQLLLAAGTLIAVAHVLAAAPPAAHALAVWPVNLASQELFLLGFAAWGALLAVFPDGCPETRLERLWLGFIPALAVVAGVVGFFDASRQPQIGVLSEPATPVPFSWSGLSVVHDASAAVFAAPIIGLLLLLLRFRRTRGLRRTQMRLPLAASCLVALALISSSLLNTWIGDAAQSYVFVTAVSTLPLALVVAMLRDGLFELDRFVLRSLVFGLLWLGIAVTYATAAALLGVSAGSRLSLGPALAIAMGATLVFQPARSWLENLADRRVYGSRLTDEEAVHRLGDALELTGDIDTLAAEVAVTVRRGLRCAWARVRVNGVEVAFDGVSTGRDPDLVSEIRHAGEVIGAIECGSPASPDEALLNRLARQIAPALHSADLSDALATRVAELSASRGRLVRAEEGERRRIERDLHDGVQAQLVALAAKVDVARMQQDSDPEGLRTTLDQASAAIRNAHSDLRELVRGIHPAVLTDHGLVRAIEARAALLPLAIRIDADESSRAGRLPHHVEGAAYFFAIEGLTNVVRHADARQARIEVTRRPDELRVAVIDDGCGFLPDQSARGLRGLADRLQALGGRLDLVSAPGAGTRLTGILPVDDHV